MAAPDPAATRGIGDLMASLAAMPAARDPDFRDLLPGTLKAQRAADLRTRLAVRGWADPRTLFTASERDDDFESALNLIADEVETAITLHPGCWYLAVPGRRRVLADRGPDELREELAMARSEADVADPVWQAMRGELDVKPLPALADLDDATVRALGLVRSWLGGDHDSPTRRSTIAAELARRERRTDIERLTAHGLIGASHLAALGALQDFAGAPFDIDRRLSAVYVHGHGGAGKSTLLAMLETAMPDALLLRLDFDDRRLDPFDPISLDLGIFEQLLARAVGPDVAGFAGRIAMLQRLRTVRRDVRSETSSAQGKQGARAESFDANTSLLDERTTIFEGSERQAVVFSSLGSAQLQAANPAIVLFLDTIEVVSARGSAAIDELARWLQSLVAIMYGRDIRVIVAGRDPPQAGDLFTALADRAGCDVESPLALPDLSEAEAFTFLTRAGVADGQVARAAAAVLPGNPLLLGIAADVLVRDPAVAADVHRAHAEGRIDRQTAARFLSQRIVPHVADPVARPYVLPAMYLPVVTLPLLQTVIMPLADANYPAGDAPLPAAGLTEARRVLAAFADSRWLTRPSEDLTQLRFHPDLRALVLTLLAADPEAQARAAAIRAHAVTFHRGRRSPEDGAWALYHALMAGGSLPPFSDRAALVLMLAPVLDDLPAAARAELVGEADGSPALPIGSPADISPGSLGATPAPANAAAPPATFDDSIYAKGDVFLSMAEPPASKRRWSLLLMGLLLIIIMLVFASLALGPKRPPDLAATVPDAFQDLPGPAAPLSELTAQASVNPDLAFVFVGIFGLAFLGYSWFRRTAAASVALPVPASPPETPVELSPEPPPMAAGPGNPPPSAAEDARSWRARLEVDGPRFVKRNNAAQALALFLEQPWPLPGGPPTFVIQALADTGDWDSPVVDDAAVLAEIEAKLPGRLRLELVARLYWLTRLALMRGDGQLSERHVEVLRAASGPLANGIGFSGLPALVAIVEAAQWQRNGRFDALAPPQWVAGKGPVATTRLALVRALADAGAPLTGLVRLDNILVSQTNWRARIRQHPSIVQIRDDDRLQTDLSALHWKPFGEVNLFLRDVRQRPPALVRLTGADADGNILVMRGLTTEFLRPLAHTLAPWLRAADVNSGLHDAIFKILAAMTIQPKEFVYERFQVMLDLDPESWSAALIGYADRSRLLTPLCEALLAADDNTPERLPCQRVARACLAWDRLMCGGASSAWPARN